MLFGVIDKARSVEQMDGAHADRFSDMQTSNAKPKIAKICSSGEAKPCIREIVEARCDDTCVLWTGPAGCLDMASALLRCTE